MSEVLRLDNRVAYWSERICGQWRDSVEGILEAGQSLVEARKEFAEAGTPFTELIGSKDQPESTKLPFRYWAAYRLIKVAQDPKVLAHALVLPPSWETLHTITKLPEKTFYEMLDAGIIRPDTQRGEIAKYLRLAKVEEDEARVLALVPKPGIYRTLVIDPAWEYDWLSLAGRAKPGYAMQSHQQLLSLDLKQWVDDEAGCHLYCWVTNNFMARACELVSHWGFQHRTLITWIKPPPFGLGSYFRNSTEHVLFATLGETTTRPAAASIPTHFEAPRGEHSEKPEKFYEIVRGASYPPYGEGNQREPRPDFTNLFTTLEPAEAAE